MDTDKKTWLDVRRRIVTDYYDLPAAKQAEADALFRSMEALAEACADQGEFETRLQASPLTAAYNDLLAGLAPYYRKNPEIEAEQARQKAASKRQTMVDNAKRKARSTLLYELNNRLPIKGYSWSEPWYYAIPFLGPALREILGTAREMRTMQHYGKSPLDKGQEKARE